MLRPQIHLLLLLCLLIASPTLAQDDDAPTATPRSLIENAIVLSNEASDVTLTYAASRTTTQRTSTGDVFRDVRVSQTEDGTALFVTDGDTNTYSATINVAQERTFNTARTSTIASFQAEWDVRALDGTLYFQAAYTAGGSEFDSIETGWRIVADPADFPLQSVAVDVAGWQAAQRPELGLPLLESALTYATEVVILEPNPDTPDDNIVRMVFDGVGAAELLEVTLAANTTQNNPVLNTIITDVRENPANTTVLTETLRFNAAGYLVSRSSTYNIVATNLDVGNILTDEDPNLRFTFNQTIVRDETLTYNTGAVLVEAPEAVSPATTPAPVEAVEVDSPTNPFDDDLIE